MLKIVQNIVLRIVLKSVPRRERFPLRVIQSGPPDIVPEIMLQIVLKIELKIVLEAVDIYIYNML